MNKDMYTVAMALTHKYGFDWTDPITRITYKAPKKKSAKKRKAARRKKR
jgi:hypothetical protein